VAGHRKALGAAAFQMPPGVVDHQKAHVAADFQMPPGAVGFRKAHGAAACRGATVSLCQLWKGDVSGWGNDRMA
jgi:hypothetical protein